MSTIKIYFRGWHSVDFTDTFFLAGTRGKQINFENEGKTQFSQSKLRNEKMFFPKNKQHTKCTQP